jgi:hypothetical protein
LWSFGIFSKYIWTKKNLATLVQILLKRQNGQMQGCQMASFQTKNPNSGKFWSFLQRKMMVNFMTISSVLLPFGIFCGHFSRFGMLCEEKSGNPGQMEWMFNSSQS